MESITTEPMGRTCYFAADRLYLALPLRGDRPAEIRVYRVENP